MYCEVYERVARVCGVVMELVLQYFHPKVQWLTLLPNFSVHPRPVKQRFQHAALPLAAQSQQGKRGNVCAAAVVATAAAGRQTAVYKFTNQI